jgi:hypothetical protein
MKRLSQALLAFALASGIHAEVQGMYKQSFSCFESYKVEQG